MYTSAPVLETERLILRAHRVDDFEAIATQWADPDVVKYIGGTPSSRETSWSRLLRYPGHWQMMGCGYWAVSLKDGTFVGEIGLADYQRDMSPSLAGLAEMGWVISPAFHGKGYAFEAARRMLIWIASCAALLRRSIWHLFAWPKNVALLHKVTRYITVP